MESLIFSSTDIVYKQVLKDIKVLEYSALISNRISINYDSRFRDHIKAIYNNTPLFFKTHFLSEEDGFKLYQKYYFLLYLIKFCEISDDIPRNYKEWAHARHYDCVEYLLKDPYPNERYNIDYYKLYREFIAYSGDSLFLLSVLKEIRDIISHNYMNKEDMSLPPSLMIELGTRHLEITKNDSNSLVFDYSKINDKFHSVGSGRGVKYNGNVLPKPKSEGIESVFNNYSRISLESLTISNTVYDNLDKYPRLYILFQSIYCNLGYVSDYDNTKGNLIFSGKFVKTQIGDEFKFVPYVNEVPIVKGSCVVKHIQFTITDENNSIIPSSYSSSITKDNICNVLFQLEGEGDLCKLKLDDASCIYSMSKRTIRVSVEDVVESAMKLAFCEISEPLYVHCCVGNDNNKVRVVKNNESFAESSSFTLNDIAPINEVKSIGKSNSDPYSMLFHTFESPYYIYPQNYVAGGAIFNEYKIYTDPLTHPLTYEIYKKSVFLVPYGESESSETIAHIEYLINTAQRCIFYRDLGNKYIIIDKPNLSEVNDLYVKIIACSHELVNEFTVSRIDDCNMYAVKNNMLNVCAYVEVNEKFSFGKNSTIYTLNADRKVQEVNPSTQTFHIYSPFDIRTVNGVEYSNFGDRIPEFILGETILKLELNDTTTIGLQEDVAYEMTKCNSSNVAIINRKLSSGIITINELNIHSTCVQKDNLYISDIPAITKPVPYHEFHITSGGDVSAVLKLD